MPAVSAFLRSYQGQAAECRASRIEGIGRPRVKPSFVPTVVDRMLGVPDGASVATMRFLSRKRAGRPMSSLLRALTICGRASRRRSRRAVTSG
jgi:cysteine synthase